ncbi:extracellular solute-binding protein [Gordonia sp. NB41Y]|uniref:extracellular solute-binding protein n=1 Tax=Gordonia sp. NB41Y TaxID=875808 RepID=UPI00128F0936|nr:extracellular solute-binding protein [Gordonia sp. NB41Y]WLP92530.1 extracellular solute-binding protein [Gordonia sp. NB41Y]
MRVARRVRMIGALGASVLAALAFTGCSSAVGGQSDEAASATVIQYNCPDQWANFPAVRAAFADESGITVPSDVKNSGQSLSALAAQRDHPQADVAYWGSNFGITAYDQGLTTPYSPAGSAEIPADLKSKDGSWTAVHYGVVAMLVNKKALGGLPVPQTWDDLLKPEYKDKVFYADPGKAAIGYYTAAAINLAKGGTTSDWQPAIDYFGKLKANGAQAPVNTTPAKAASGEYPILIDADFNGYAQKYDNGADLDVVIPSDGTVKVSYAVSLVKDGPNPAGAKKWMDFLLSDTGQQLFAKFYVHPVRGTMPADIAARMAPQSDYDKARTVDIGALAAAQDGFVTAYTAAISG